MSSRGGSGGGSGSGPSAGAGPGAGKGAGGGEPIDSLFASLGPIGLGLLYGLITAFIVGWVWYAGFLTGVTLGWPPVVHVSTPLPMEVIWATVGVLGAGWVLIIGSICWRLFR